MEYGSNEKVGNARDWHWDVSWITYTLIFDHHPVIIQNRNFVPTKLLRTHL